MGLVGLAVCAFFAVSAMRALKSGADGHTRNAAVIHIALLSMLVPLTLYALIAHAP
jgi:hypothetical protein